jgi:drug/metabolite transporter (DMT)-like permease
MTTRTEVSRPATHTRAVAQALLVTFLWSTSWVLIKWGLADIPALVFAGLRYTLAFLILLPFVMRPKHLSSFAPCRAASGCS